VIECGLFGYFQLNILFILRKKEIHFHQNETWIKFGGDHGGESFKFWFAPLCTDKPNSEQCTVCVLVYRAKESVHNLEVSVGMLAQDIANLQQTRWR
jgi:hypothetical protein